MSNFYFSDKSYCYGDIIREVRIQVGNILNVITLEKNANYWCIHFYNLKKNEPNQYIWSVNISSDLALNIIKEAKEYKEYKYSNS